METPFHYFLYQNIMMWASYFGYLLFFSLPFVYSSGNDLPTVDLGYEIHQATNFNVCQPYLRRESRLTSIDNWPLLQFHRH